MFYLEVLLVLTTCLSWSWSYDKVEYYCKICPDHTMCLYNDVGKACKDVGDAGISEKEKKEILDVHNWVRRIVATGHEKRGVDGPQPKASNLMKFEWDNNLMTVAQRWADQCRFEHDTCRDDPRWKVGQNIYWKWRYPTHSVNWTEAIMTWYDEVALYNPKEVGAYRHESATGHYTQVLWHDTYKIGCGRRDYGENKLYVCNYGPAGNWLEEAMYIIGEPCSNCPAGTYCDQYLCDNFDKNGNTRSESTYRPPMLEKNIIPEAPTKIRTPETRKSDSDLSNSMDSRSKLFNALQTLITKMIPSNEDENEPHNRINENDAELDSETKSAIEEIKFDIIHLVKKVLRKCISQ